MFGYVHQTDVGGKVPGSLSPSSYEVFQEGIRIVPTKLYETGFLNEWFLKIYLANCRVPQDNWGDLKAIVTALNTGEHRLHQLLERFGPQILQAGIDDVLDYAERRAVRALRTIPDGCYSFVDYLDDDVVSDIPIRCAVTVTARDGHLHLDFNGSDPQLRSAFNIPSSGKAHPWLVYKLMSYLLTQDPGIPMNGGMFRPISVSVPAGSTTRTARRSE